MQIPPKKVDALREPVVTVGRVGPGDAAESALVGRQTAIAAIRERSESSGTDDGCLIVTPFTRPDGGMVEVEVQAMAAASAEIVSVIDLAPQAWTVGHFRSLLCPSFCAWA